MDLTGIPVNATCLEVLNGVFYAGDTVGQLWAGDPGGSVVNSTLPAVSNEVSDNFGNALSLGDDFLAIGAPDYSGAAVM